MDFPGPYRVGKYGVNLENFHRVALPALEVGPGVDLIVVDEVGKMECLSARFVAAMESLWAAPVPLLVTVAAERRRLHRGPEGEARTKPCSPSPPPTGMRSRPGYWNF